MNPLLSMLSGGGGATQILMQAVGAAMRGETPESFMKTLARTHPQLKGLDMDNLESTANSLAQQKGTSVDQVAASVKKTIGGFM